jgi:hypothetical protein
MSKNPLETPEGAAMGQYVLFAGLLPVDAALLCPRHQLSLSGPEYVLSVGTMESLAPSGEETRSVSMPDLL